MNGNSQNDNSGDICSICTENMKFKALIGPCNHTVCHLCCLRLTILYKSKVCPLCKTAVENIHLTDILNDPIEKVKKVSRLLNKDYQIWSYTNNAASELSRLLSFECPQVGCRNVFSTQKELQKHIKSAHDLELCEICLEHNKVFSFEYQLFTKSSLRYHIDPSKKSSAKSPLEKNHFASDGTGHPMCEFCKFRFYSEDEFYSHCEQIHETCFICKRLHPQAQTYYKNMAELDVHFRSKHYACNNQKCVEEKFVVFETEAELKHHLGVHLEGRTDLQRCHRRKLQSLQASQYFTQISGDLAASSSGSFQRRDQSRPGGRRAAPDSSINRNPEPTIVAAPAPQKVIASFGTLKITNENDLSLNAINSLAAACKTKESFKALNNKYLEFIDGSLEGSALIKYLAGSFGANEINKICDLIIFLESNIIKKKILQTELAAYINKNVLFPTLPATPKPVSTASTASSVTHNKQLSASFSGAQKAKLDFLPPSKPVVIKLTSKKEPVRWGEQLNKCNTKEKPKFQPMPVCSSSVSACTPETKPSAKNIPYQLSCNTRATSKLTEKLVESFPTLRVTDPNFSEDRSLLPQADESDDFHSDSFVLGTESLSSHISTENQSTPSQQSSLQALGHQKKRPKKQVLFHVTL